MAAENHLGVVALRRSRHRAAVARAEAKCRNRHLAAGSPLRNCHVMMAQNRAILIPARITQALRIMSRERLRVLRTHQRSMEMQFRAMQHHREHGTVATQVDDIIAFQIQTMARRISVDS